MPLHCCCCTSTADELQQTEVGTATVFSWMPYASALIQVIAVNHVMIFTLCLGLPRDRTWLQRLLIEETRTPFDYTRTSAALDPENKGFQYTTRGKDNKVVTHVKLEGMGPRILVSGQSTADTPHGLLRWQLVVKGNTALEFGACPLELQVSIGYGCMASKHF